MSLRVASAPQLCARPSAPLRRKGRLCLRSGRRAVRVSALFGAKPVAVPLNLYAALGVPPRAPAGVVDVAAAERAAQPPGGAAELSPAALRARGELLALAGRTLASPARRAAYETALASASADVEVPLGALPGALLLLQEAGDLATALRVGAAALQGRSAGREWRRDVCHALALCHAEAASSSLARPTPDVVSAYLSLEHAQAALGAAPGRAQGLAAKVDEAVAEYGPEFALEALALPLSSQGTSDPRLRAARAQGARVLRALLWARGPQGELSPRLKGRRDEFTTQALRLLSAPEAADLFFEAPKAPQGMPQDATSPHQLMSACVAALAAGFTQRSVRRVRQAAAQLTQLARTQPFQAAPPVPVAEVDAPAAEGAADAAVAVAAHAAVDARVALCVARLLLGETAEAMDAISDDAGARAMVGRFPSPLAGMVALAERWLAEQALPRFRDTAMGGPASCSPSLSLWFATPAVAAALDDSLATAPMRALAELADARAAGASRRAQRALGAPPEYRHPSANARLTSLASSATPLGAALALAAILAAASLILPTRAPPRPLPISAAAARIASAAAAASRNSVELLADAATGVLRGGAAQPMDVSLASSVIRRWQGIKASALGGRHDVSALDGVLEGPMLRQWRSRAEDVRHNGFYWDYVLLNLRVDSLRVSPKGDSARVEATLTEAALLHDAAQPGAEQEAYESTYRARYELVRKGGAGGGARAWRIVAGTVLY